VSERGGKVKVKRESERQGEMKRERRSERGVGRQAGKVALLFPAYQRSLQELRDQVSSEEGSFLELVDFGIIQLWARK
jgi:hypothetical protein